MHRVGEKRKLTDSSLEFIPSSELPPKKKKCRGDGNLTTLRGILHSCMSVLVWTGQGVVQKLRNFLPISRNQPELQLLESPSSMSTPNRDSTPSFSNQAVSSLCSDHERNGMVTSTPRGEDGSPFHVSSSQLLSSSQLSPSVVSVEEEQHHAVECSQPAKSTDPVFKTTLFHNRTSPTQKKPAIFNDRSSFTPYSYPLLTSSTKSFTPYSCPPPTLATSLIRPEHTTKLSSCDRTDGFSMSHTEGFSSNLRSRTHSSAVLEIGRTEDSPSQKSPNTARSPEGFEAKYLYWLQWIKDFKGTHKHLQAEQQAVMQVAKTKLQLSRKQRMELEDKRIAKLRSGLSRIDLDSDDEDEEPSDFKWVLDAQQMERVTMAIKGGNDNECLSERYRIRVSRGDLHTLTGLVWLNDEVINFYFNLISECCRKQNGLKVHVFNSFFYSKLSQSGYAGVRRWTKKVDLFSHDLILLPVHLGMHWCLAVIDFKSCQFLYYDSLLGSNSVCLARLRDYLRSECLDKKSSEFDLTGWHDHTPKDIPSQTNSSDCGVFTCMYARHKAKEIPFNFSQDDMADIRKHMIYEILEQSLL